jgi:hypothetical protein
VQINLGWREYNATTSPCMYESTTITIAKVEQLIIAMEFYPIFSDREPFLSGKQLLRKEIGALRHKYCCLCPNKKEYISNSPAVTQLYKI